MFLYKTETQEILNTFSKSTDLGVLCFDTELNVVAFSPSKSIVNDFICLENNQITTFLADKFSEKPTGSRILHTFFLDSNLVSNVCLLARDGSYIAAFATQPVFVRKLDPNEFDDILDRLSPTMKERSTLWNVLMAVPVIPYERIISIGGLLDILSRANLTETPGRQVLRYHDVSPGQRKQNITVGEQREDVNEGTGDREYAVFLQLKESIRNGDAIGIRDFIDEIRTGDILVNRSNPMDFLPALKRTFTKVCAMGCHIAIEAGAPYKKVMDLCDDFDRQSEKLDNINGVYSLLKTAMMAFARTVSLNNSIAYSKPVRQVIEYITGHYSEKITLDKLARHTNLSTYYLSNMIKKETGLMLADHINRIRIEQSKKLLRDTDMSILEIAQEVGYNYQNHFASIFRRQTGFTPTEYKSVAGTDQILKKNETLQNAAIPIVLEQTYNKLSIFEGMYDTARIVDPVAKVSWKINPENELCAEPTLCHNYWNKNESCRECIAMRAFGKNETVLKVKENDDDIYLLLAAPKTIGDKTYAIEIVKKVTGQIFFDLKADPRDNPDGFECAASGAPPALYSQKHILEKLTTHMKRNKANGKSLSIILAVLEGEGLRDDSLDEYIKVINRSLRSESDWTGRYIGNVFLIALDDVDEKDAVQIKNRVDLNYRIALEKANHGGAVKVHYAIKGLSLDIMDPGALIRLAFMELYSDITVA
jgi:AraC-type DNA-binding domain-containing proteins